MNRVYLAQRSLLPPARARQWHALHVSANVAVVVVDWDESPAEDEWEALAGVVALPHLLDQSAIPAAVSAALASRGITDTDTTFQVLRRLRAAWSMARERF